MNTHINLVEKVSTAAEAISGYSEIFQGDHADRIVSAEDLIWRQLGNLGITKDNEESHSLIADGFCKEGDARAIFCEGDPPVLPLPWFRKMWVILSDAETVETGNPVADAIKGVVDASKSPSQQKDEPIIEAYGIDCSGEILDEFKKRAGGKAVVAFEDESTGTVNVEITLEVLRQSRRRNLPKIYKNGDNVYKLYTVGDFPSEIYEESPLAPGKLLFNGYCDETEMNFSNVSKEARQFLRVAYNKNKTPGNSDRMAMLGLVSAAEKGISELKKLFPTVGIDYDGLAKTDDLPSLKRTSSDETSTEGASDPFGGNKRF